MQGVSSLQPGYYPYPLVDQRWAFTRIVHQVIFLFDYFFYKVRDWCSWLCGAPVAAYQHLPISEFQNLGGRVEKVRFDLDTSRMEGSKMELARDVPIYPVCVAGRNRSQITKHMLEHMGATNVEKPHGALLGMDVIDESDDHEMVRFFGSMRMCSCQDDLGEFGTLTRVRRVGEEETEDLDKFQRRDWMDRNYFLRIIQQPKGVVITYMESFAPMVARLVEVANRYGLGLHNVTVVSIDSLDPCPNCVVPQFVTCLKELFSVR